MKLLFDQNLSHKLAAALADLFPDSLHVRDKGLQTADDTTVWEFARDNGLTIVSKDDDFRQRSLVHGHPPKIVWVKLGNCSTSDIGTALRNHVDDLRRLEADASASLLMITTTGAFLLVHPPKPSRP